MFDVAAMTIQEFSKAIVAEHAQKAAHAKWRIELEDLERIERAKAGDPKLRKTASPTELNGAHSPWI
jgi:hypothetical protein